MTKKCTLMPLTGLVMGPPRLRIACTHPAIAHCPSGRWLLPRVQLVQAAAAVVGEVVRSFHGVGSAVRAPRCW